MPRTGYNFTCENKKCKAFNSGFNLHEEWPLGRIDDIVKTLEDGEHKNFLLKIRSEGRNLALITLPNNSNIPVIGKRRQLFCPKENIKWEDDFENNVAPLPRKICENCSSNLLTPNEVFKNGIICPHCGSQMKKELWLSNEKE